MSLNEWSSDTLFCGRFTNKYVTYRKLLSVKGREVGKGRCHQYLLSFQYLPGSKPGSLISFNPIAVRRSRKNYSSFTTSKQRLNNLTRVSQQVFTQTSVPMWQKKRWYSAMELFRCQDRREITQISNLLVLKIGNVSEACLQTHCVALTQLLSGEL